MERDTMPPRCTWSELEEHGAQGGLGVTLAGQAPCVGSEGDSVAVVPSVSLQIPRRS